MDDARESYQSAVDAVGLLAAFLITVIYLHLSRRAAKEGGVPRANFLLAAFVIAWTASGMASCLIGFIPSRDAAQEQLFQIAQALEKVFALLWLIPTLSLWKEALKTTGPRNCIVMLQTAVVITATTILFLYVWSAFGPASRPVYHPILFRISFVTLTLPPLVAGFITLSRRTIEPVTRLSLATMLLGTLGLACSLSLLNLYKGSPLLGPPLNAATAWFPLVIITGVIILFARFRFADHFIRHCMRIVSAATVGIVTATILSALDHPFTEMDTLTDSGLALMTVAVLTSLAFGAYARGEACLNSLIDRYVFPAPDYHAIVVAFQQDLLRIDREEAVVQASGALISSTLQMEQVHAVQLSRADCSSLDIPFIGSTTPVAIAPRRCSPPVLPGVEVVAPFRVSEDHLEALALRPGGGRRGLVTHEMKFIGVVASQLANRLQSIQHQKALLESQSRETRLQQQVTAAELQALRAQINPHFLFNALNTLADLIRVDAASAETMTLRLAQIFRYVLAHTSRPVVSLREEMEFLRSYLDIEEARFGDRLVVGFEIDPAANSLLIPSLILQPIVENALKHGLAPKPGPGHLWIKAAIHDGKLCIAVEDDGLGLPLSYSRHPSGHGVGLDNTRRRLETQYSGHASFLLESREPSGVRALITLPLPSSAP